MRDPVVLDHPAPLVEGVFLGRRQRFFADVELDRKTRVVAHCVNTGKMEGLLVPGRRVWLSRAPEGSARKLRYTWELVELDGMLVGANTLVANRIARKVLEAKALSGLARYAELRPEHRYGERSRVDFWLRSGEREHFVEVKNCHLVYPDGVGYFPDARSERGERHLRELAEVVGRGHRATVLFVLQRPDARRVRPSDVHDPEFASAAREAAARGVRFRGLSVRPTLFGYVAERELPVDLAPYPLGRVQRWRSDPPGSRPEPQSRPRARKSQ